MNTIPNGQGKITLGEEKINEVTGQLAACSGDLQQICSSLDEICEDLKAVFKGKCADSYAQAIQNIETNVLVPMKKLIDSYPQALNDASNAMFSNDEELAQNIYGKYSSLY